MKNYLLKFLFILPFVALSGCLMAQNMELVYTVVPTGKLKKSTVYLVVNDNRTSSDTVGPDAKKEGLFRELNKGTVGLHVTMPDGAKIIMTNMSIIDAVRESAKRKLLSQGVNSTSVKSENQLTVEINIDELNIDLVDGELVATVALSSDIYKDQETVAKSNAKTVSNRMQLLGGTGGATVLSEALTQCMNDLDLGGINNF